MGQAPRRTRTRKHAHMQSAQQSRRTLPLHMISPLHLRCTHEHDVGLRASVTLNARTIKRRRTSAQANAESAPTPNGRPHLAIWPHPHARLSPSPMQVWQHKLTHSLVPGRLANQADAHSHARISKRTPETVFHVHSLTHTHTFTPAHTHTQA